MDGTIKFCKPERSLAITMYEKVYDNIIIGGTYVGVGALLNGKGNSLLISKNVFLEDFSPAFKFEIVNYKNELYQEFEQKGLISNLRLNLARASIELYKKVADKTVLYKTLVSDIQPNLVTVHNSDGTNSIRCKNVIITQKAGSVIQKYYNALVEAEATFAGEDFEIVETCFSERRLLRLRLDEEATYDEARLRLLNFIKQFPKTKLILSAYQFDIKQKQGDDELLSCNFSDPFEGFERGAQYAKSLD